jgi:hypothetical protein
MEAIQMPMKNLPPLAVGQAYQAADFESFDYAGSKLTGSKAILRLHLKNKTTIDLPTTNDELHVLLRLLCDAFGPVAIAHLKNRKWI